MCNISQFTSISVSVAKVNIKKVLSTISVMYFFHYLVVYLWDIVV